MITTIKSILNLFLTKETAECGAFALFFVFMITLPIGDGMNSEKLSGNYVKAQTGNQVLEMYALKAHKD